MSEKSKRRIVVALTGASGAIYGIDLLTRLLSDFDGMSVYCTATPAGLDILKRELGQGNPEDAVKARASAVGARLKKDWRKNLEFFASDNFDAPFASGSFYFDAMAISPCSMNTLGKCANSLADNLVVRAAEVALKELRRLVVVPRETPLAQTQLANMLKLSQAGAVVLPACPAFYGKAESVDDLVAFVSARTISAMGLKQRILKEWGNVD